MSQNDFVEGKGNRGMDSSDQDEKLRQMMAESVMASLGLAKVGLSGPSKELPPMIGAFC